MISSAEVSLCPCPAGLGGSSLEQLDKGKPSLGAAVTEVERRTGQLFAKAADLKSQPENVREQFLKVREDIVVGNFKAVEGCRQVLDGQGARLSGPPFSCPESRA